VAADAIVDPDPWDSVTYRVSMPDQSAVPAWLQFDAASRTLTATPAAADVGTLRFGLWGSDSQSRAAGHYVSLDVAPPAPLPASDTHLLASRQLDLLIHPLAGLAPPPMGLSSFGPERPPLLATAVTATAWV